MDYGLSEAVKITKIERKNIQRWIELGPIRKKGGGRKVKDTQME